MIRRGFTVVELVITITIMGILLTLAVVNLNATQANARDVERKGDAESIATHMENYYRNQNPDLAYGGGGTYLGTTHLNDNDLKLRLPDLDLKSTRSPGNDVEDPTNLVAATNAITTETGIAPLPSSTNDVYVYQPLTANGGLCALPLEGAECRRFNLYYYQETSDTVVKIMSKHQ